MDAKHRHQHEPVKTIRPSFARQIGADLKRREHMKVYQRGYQQLEYLQQTGRLTDDSYAGVVERMRIAINGLDIGLEDGLRDMEKRAQGRWRR